MDQQRIAKHLIEQNKEEFDKSFNTMISPRKNSDRTFFRFVDKNPLFGDNSHKAIHEYLVSSRKKEFAYKPHQDENFEVPEVYLYPNDARKG